MPKLDNVRIDTGNPNEKYAYHAIDSDQGYLRSRYCTEDDTYDIRDYVVYQSYRRQGYGKELLRIASQHAKLLGAKAVVGSMIISRESIDALGAVFGPESLVIEQLGDYIPSGYDSNQQHPTRASMVYSIPDDAVDHEVYGPLIEQNLKDIHPMVMTYNKVIVSLTTKILSLDEKTDENTLQLSSDEILTYESLHELRSLIISIRDQI